MMHCSAQAIQSQARLAAPQVARRSCRRLVVAASGKKQTVWNGEGPDYTMRDVERLHDEVAARAFHLPADDSQWNGEGPDYGMKDVERFHEATVARAGAGGVRTVFNGEGPEYSMNDVERFHDEVAAKMKSGPDASQYNGEGPDYTMADVERFHEEAAKDKAVRRK